MKILIVAADYYAELIPPFLDFLNQIGHYEASSMTIAEYSSNEILPTDDQAVVFIGDPSENPFTAYYYPKMAFRLENEAGASYGESKNRVLIFGDGDISHRHQLKVIMNEQKTGFRNGIRPEKDGTPSFWGYAALSFVSLHSFLLGALAAGGLFIYGKVMKKKIKFLQVILGIDRFLEALACSPSNTQTTNE